MADQGPAPSTAAQGPAPATAAAAEAEDTREARKLFVGGVPDAATEADLRGYFSRFGVVRSAVVMRNRETGHGRGFGFVEFLADAAADRALADADEPGHCICGKQVDVKRARKRPLRIQGNKLPAEDSNVSYESKKVFVGGLRDIITDDEFRAYFQTFGTVTDSVVIYDSFTKRPRGFGFVTFDSEDAVNKVMRKSFHNLNGTMVEAKIAVPKDEQYYYSQGHGKQPFGMWGPATYEGRVFQQYTTYGLYNGYTPQPITVQPFYPPYFVVPYASGYPSQGVMTTVPGMMVWPVPSVYGSYHQMHPGFNFVSGGAFGDPATTFQNGFNGGSENKKDQTTVNMQDVVSTASIATKLEHMNIGSQ